MTLVLSTRNLFVACKAFHCHYQGISLVPRDELIRTRNTGLDPGGSLAPGDFSAVSGGKEAASRSHVAPRKPDVASGVLYLHLGEPSQVPLDILINSWKLKCGSWGYG